MVLDADAVTRPTRVDHAAVARALAVANARTGLFKKGRFMHDTPRVTSVAEAERAEWRDEARYMAGLAEMAACNPQPDGDVTLVWRAKTLLTIARLLREAEPPVPPMPRVMVLRPMSHQEREAFLTAWQAAPSGSLVIVPDDPHDVFGRAVIEAACEWGAADMDTDAQAGDRLSAAVRAYETALDTGQRRNGDVG